MGTHGEDKEERKPTPLRTANGIVAAVLVAIFLAHALLGSVKFADLSFNGKLVWVVWVGVALIAVHILMSIGTTVSMLRDTKRPPSQKKKRHQLMKWLSGGALLAAAAVHFARTSGFFTGGAVAALNGATFALMAVVAITLGWHVYTASKSLLKDLHVPDHKRYRPWMQAAFLAVIVTAGVIMAFSVLR